MTSLAEALRALLPVIQALAEEAEAREQGRDEMLTQKRAAARIGTSVSHISKLMGKGLLPTVRIGSRGLRVPSSALEKYIAAQSMKRSA